MLKFIALIISSIFLCVSCSVVPVVKSHSPRDIECGMATHEYDLRLVEMGGITASCDSAECILSLGIFAAAWTGFTAVISGSIVVIGNTVHWLEQQGPCDEERLEQQVIDLNQPLIKQGGERIYTKEEFIQRLKEEK